MTETDSLVKKNTFGSTEFWPSFRIFLTVSLFPFNMLTCIVDFQQGDDGKLFLMKFL